MERVVKINRAGALISMSVLLIVSVAAVAQSQSKDAKRIAEATKEAAKAAQVFTEIMNVPDRAIPQKLLDNARAIAVFPGVIKAGFIVGGRAGEGVISRRVKGGWSAPAFFTIGGGSFGLQIGGQAVDLVMLIMNKNGMDNLLSSQFKLGADASAAAGPVGRHASADTDWKMRAQVLTYSRARGLFAGLELHGAVIKQDKDSTREFYGRMVPFKTSLTGEIEPPKAAYPFLSTLAKWAQSAAK